MGRFPQGKGEKGSLKWIQYFINKAPKKLNQKIGDKIKWFSPLAKDDYAEYRDSKFLDLLNVKLKDTNLSKFWPKRGPQWDALGKSESGEIILVEAKSHIEEMFSSSSASAPKSVELIDKSLSETADALNAKPGLNWAKRFYQYSNRLAHAYFLNEINTVPTKLVFVNFINDQDMNGPKNKSEWKAALKVLHEALGINGNLPEYVSHVYLDVKEVGT